MREIVNIQIGNGGNKIGLDFWESLQIEHQLDYYGNSDNSSDYQKEQLDVYFCERSTGNYQARSVQVDSDPDDMNRFSEFYLKNLFNQSNFLFGDSSAGKSYSKGYYELDLQDQIQETVRLLTEQSDSLQGFQLMRSLGGGTGSGLGNLIFQQLKETYPNKIISNFCIFPTPGVNDIIVEPYNTVLSLPDLHENQGFCFSFHNRALYDIQFKIKGNSTPSLNDLNSIIKQTISGVTSLWRFPSQISNDMRKFGMNLIPYNNLNYINIGLAPLYHKDYNVQKEMSLLEMSQILENNRNFMNHSFNIKQSVEFSSNYVFRCSDYIQNEVIEKIKLENKDQLNKQTYQIPDNKQIIQISQTFHNLPTQTALKISSGSSVKEMLESQLENFKSLFKRKQFLFNFICIDEMEFVEAQANLEDIISYYNELENCQRYPYISEDTNRNNNLTQFEQDSTCFTSLNF